MGLFTTLCVDSAVYYRVWWVVYHAMCRLCLFIIESGGLFTTLCVDSVHLEFDRLVTVLFFKTLVWVIFTQNTNLGHKANYP